MPEKQIFGLSAALVTPFRADGAVDHQRLVAHAGKVLAEGCDSVTVFGTTGEGYGLSLPERASILGALAGGGIDPAQSVYAGVSSVTFDDAVEQSRIALDAGSRGLLFAPPFYLKGVEDEGLYAWFSRAIERIGPSVRGVILYNIPGQTAVALSVGLVGRLKNAFPGIITGVKDSSGSWESAEAFLEAHGDLAILIGDERQLARAVRKGAQGSICGFGNFAPQVIRPVIYEGKDSGKVTDIVDTLLKLPVMPAVKALVAHIRDDREYMRTRPPLTELPPAQAAQLSAAFEQIMASEGTMAA